MKPFIYIGRITPEDPLTIEVFDRLDKEEGRRKPSLSEWVKRHFSEIGEGSYCLVSSPIMVESVKTSTSKVFTFADKKRTS